MVWGVRPAPAVPGPHTSAACGPPSRPSPDTTRGVDVAWGVRDGWTGVVPTHERFARAGRGFARTGRGGGVKKLRPPDGGADLPAYPGWGVLNVRRPRPPRVVVARGDGGPSGVASGGSSTVSDKSRFATLRDRLAGVGPAAGPVRARQAARAWGAGPRCGSIIEPSGRISPVSSKVITPLQRRLHPCSGCAATIRAASRSLASAAGQGVWCWHIGGLRSGAV